MQHEAAAELSVEGSERKLIGVLVQLDGDRAFLDRHLIYEGAEAAEIGSYTARMSDDGFWCVELKYCKQARMCPQCRGTLRESAKARARKNTAIASVAEELVTRHRTSCWFLVLLRRIGRAVR
jgi:hypothetical protein